MYSSLATTLREQHQTLIKIAERVSEKRMMLSPAPGKWSIHDNITHLAKYQPIVIERVQRILTTQEPTFERYVAEQDPDFETWRAWTTEHLLSVLGDDRKCIVSIIEGLSEEQLNRIGVHLRFGKLTVVQWTEFFLLHEAHHIYTIFQLANDTMLPKR